jgi:molybdenum cofactor cytidylyltransferase
MINLKIILALSKQYHAVVSIVYNISAALEIFTLAVRREIIDEKNTENLTIVMEKTTDNIGLILLAAGASKRLGKLKQLLHFSGETLLQRAVKTALASECRPLIIVLGANAEKLAREIEEFDVELVENTEWENGMGTSIQIGIKHFSENYPNAAAVVLMVCDQPFVSVDLIEQLVRSFRRTNAPVTASSYGNTVGVPALFSRKLFPELMQLKADNGAKKIIYEHRENVIKIPFEEGLIDVDTEQDYLNLMKSVKSDFE